MAKRPRKPRDYAAEYARRIERGKQRGISKAAARGHTKKGFLSPRVAASLGVSPDTPISELRDRLAQKAPDVPGRHKLETGKELTDEQRAKIIESLIRVHEMDIEEVSGIEYMDEPELLEYLLDSGFTAAEAYDLRFSPEGD